LVVAEVVRVRAKFPLVVKLLANVRRFDPLLTPVPPKVPVTIEPFHVPVVIVPREVMAVCTAEGSVDEIEGTPPPEVIRTPLLPVARLPRIPALLYSKPLDVPPEIGLTPTVKAGNDAKFTGPGKPPAVLPQT